VKGVIDIGKSSDINDFHRIAYIKNAQVSWKKDKFILNGGLISTTQFNFQEKFWGYRYIMKSFQDQYKYGSSADLGISATYKFTNWFSADAIIVNGEGYKKIQINNGLNYGIGLTINPIKRLSVRIYGGLNESANAGTKDIINFSSFVGYSANIFRIGMEYNYMQNSDYKADANKSGLSFFGTIKLLDNIDIYARLDEQYSKKDWNKAKDEHLVIVGTELKLGKYVKIAPNFRVGIPKSNNAKENYAAYINCYFGL
jgi:hypothetical protein